MLQRPFEHRSHVVEFRRHEVDVPRAGDADGRACAGAIGELHQPIGLESPQGSFLTRGSQALTRELADRLEHPEALVLVRVGAAADEAESMHTGRQPGVLSSSF